jgi:Fe-S cluster assembly protein SufD
VSTLLKPTGTPAERFTSRSPDDFPIPTTAQEDWRFTPLARIRDFFEPFEPEGAAKPDIDAPDPVRTAVVGMDDGAVGRVLQPADRVSALAYDQVPGALVITIPAGTELDSPVVVHLDGQDARTYGHLVIDAEANSAATVVLQHTGTVRAAVNVETVVGDGARLTLASAQNWDQDAVHLAAHAALVGRDATYRHVNVTLGGAIVRIVPTVRFAGSGGTAEMLGVSFAGDGQHFESRLFIDHGEPNCTSNVLYKNALRGDSARTVWIGDVRIRPAATGTQTYEMNRNLLLSDGARADSVPNLEIETGQIRGAGHASATGRFDDLQLFYLQARGIPEDEARRLVVRGFFADVVERIGVPELERQIMSTIEARLGFVPELENES